MLLTAPSDALWWGIFYCLAECAVVYGGFAWLSGCVNRALHTASDCVQRLIDGIPESDGAAAFFSQEDTVTGKLQTQIYKLYDIMKAHEEQELALKNQLSGLVADLVHQMNTPLTNIRMYCDFLQMPDLSAENKSHFLSNISRQAEKLGWFGEGFEKAARLETDIITLTPVEQELLPIILEAANQASPRAEAKGREIRLEGDRGIRVCVDGKWTLEAVFNLLDNAVKYGAQGSDILVRMSAYELYACIEVCSEGNRIPEAERNMVFQRFYRGKQAAMLQEGVGLGLFLTRKIISDQGGYVSIDNYGENGNSFRIFVRRSGDRPGTEEEGGIARSVDAAGAL
ncbi:sensor histidine kinase [Eisenbergiella massiliensis]|uniref:sensor histidine kinase n=2 Tax=Eisenbergiella TaxID=1432051 RepID=UPI0015E1AC00|nr:HAMP domain-containing sensor histidine kinase [Eisenbergiella massiliensis]